MDAADHSTRKSGKLREFSTQLAERLRNAPAQKLEPMRLAIRIGQDGFLVDMTTAGEILALPEIAAVPWTRPWFRGLTNVRGRLVGVVDLVELSGRGRLAADDALQLLVFNESMQVNAALLVTRAFGIRNLNDLESLGRSNTPAPPWEQARYRDLDGAVLTEIDLKALAGTPGFTAIGT